MFENEKIALFIRHAERDEIPKGSFGNEILLNEKGKLSAYNFGSNLKNRKISRIFTSPVKRCVQTAEFITNGYGNSLEIIETTALGAPGLHITDEKSAGQYFLEYGSDVVYERFIKGENIPGVTNISDLNFRITNFINENSDENGITIFITHDILIAFYQYSLNQKIYRKDEWINYLSGLTLNNHELEGN